MIVHFIEAWGVSCRATAQPAAKRGEAGTCSCAPLAPQGGGHLYVEPIANASGFDATSGQRAGDAAQVPRP